MRAMMHVVSFISKVNLENQEIGQVSHHYHSSLSSPNLFWTSHHSQMTIFFPYCCTYCPSHIFWTLICAALWHCLLEILVQVDFVLCSRLHILWGVRLFSPWVSMFRGTQSRTRMKNHWNAKKLQNEMAQPTAFTKTGDVSKIPQLDEDEVLIQ